MLGILYINPGSKKAHADHVSTALAVMRKQEKFSDLQFVCKDDSCSTSARIITAHQSIFEQRSALLKALFSIARSKQPYDRVAITLDSVSASIMEKLIEYIYEGKTMIDNEQSYELDNLCKLLQIELPLKAVEMHTDTEVDFYRRQQNGTIAEVEFNSTVNDTSTYTMNSIVSTTGPADLFHPNGPVNGMYSISTPIAREENVQFSGNRNGLWNYWKNSYSNFMQEVKQEPQIATAYSISDLQSNFKKPNSNIPLKDTTNTKPLNSAHTTTGPFQCELCKKDFTNEREYALHSTDSHLPNIASLDDQTTTLSGIKRTNEKDQPSSNEQTTCSNSSMKPQGDIKSNTHKSKKAIIVLDGCARTRIYVAKSKLPSGTQMNDFKDQNTKGKKNPKIFYRCDQCNKEYSTCANLDRHNSTVHENVKRFKCGFCEYKSARKDHLQKHLNKVHTE